MKTRATRSSRTLAALACAASLVTGAALAACGTAQSTAPADAGALDAASDAPAPDAPPDARCTGLVVDDAGVTHGCAPGGQGPGDRDDGGGAAPPPPDASLDASHLPFGASCWDNAQCESGICFDYTVKGTFCTQTCSSAQPCPPQSLGCNGQGVCRVGN